MTLEQRAEAYSRTFPKYPTMWVSNGWLMGVWVLGNLYKRASSYYGAFPGNFYKRVIGLFPNRGGWTLHLFSGVLPKEEGSVRVDIHLDLKPDVVADARHLPFLDRSFDFVLADPPYSKADAEHYNTPLPSRLFVVREIARVVAPGGYLCWLDTVRPMYSKLLWKQVGAVAVLVSTNTRTRCLSIFERTTP